MTARSSTTAATTRPSWVMRQMEGTRAAQRAVAPTRVADTKMVQSRCTPRGARWDRYATEQALAQAGVLRR